MRSNVDCMPAWNLSVSDVAATHESPACLILTSIRLQRDVSNCWIGILKSKGCAAKAADAQFHLALDLVPGDIEALAGLGMAAELERAYGGPAAGNAEMRCPQCGNRVLDDERFCTACGARVR